MTNDDARAAPEALPGRLSPALLLRIDCRPDHRRPDDTGIRRAADAGGDRVAGTLAVIAACRRWGPQRGVPWSMRCHAGSLSIGSAGARFALVNLASRTGMPGRFGWSARFRKCCCVVYVYEHRALASGLGKRKVPG